MALKRLKELGATDEDLTDLARGVQYEAAYSVLYTLSDPVSTYDDLLGELPELEEIGWELIETESDKLTGRSVGTLFESFLSMDPTGREMRPRRSPD